MPVNSSVNQENRGGRVTLRGIPPRDGRKPHIFRQRGHWWVLCKHGDRTGPYRDMTYAILGAAVLWEMHGPYRKARHG